MTKNCVDQEYVIPEALSLRNVAGFVVFGGVRRLTAC